MSAVFRENEAFGEDPDVPAVDAFYFRLSDKNLYYAQDASSMVVLGAIAITNVESVQESELDTTRCFEIQNAEKDEWSLCAITAEEKDEWMCAINTAIGQPCGEEEEEADEESMRHHKRS